MGAGGSDVLPNATSDRPILPISSARNKKHKGPQEQGGIPYPTRPTTTPNGNQNLCLSVVTC
eukprot:912749-Amorphochlora_amoeboformis.AAC.2